MSKKLAWLDAEDEFAAHFSAKNQYVFPFHDARAAMAHGGTQRIFTTEHPSDFIIVDDGEMFFAEVKKCSNPTTFPLGNIRRGQWAAAIQTVAAKGSYFFFIRHDPEKKWYKVPANVMIAIRETKKSIRWEDIKHYEWEI